MLGPRGTRGSGAIAGNAHNSGGSYYPSRPSQSHNREGEPKTPPLSAYRDQDAHTHASSASQAKRLISQYESMSTPSCEYSYAYAPHSDPDAGAAPYDLSSAVMTKISREKSTKKKQYVYDYRSKPGNGLQAPVNGGPRGDTHIGHGSGGAAKKAPSPIRQSLRNLIAVIKKGALGKKRDTSEGYYSGDNAIGTLQRRKKKDERQEEQDATLKIKAKTKEVNPPPALDLRSKANTSITVDSGPRVSQPPAGKKKATGTLLYLIPFDSKPIPTRTWKTYTATLDPVAHTLHLSSSLTNLTRISLVGCTDIRSLDASKLPKAEREGLEKKAPHQEIDKLKAFEIRYKDESKEKFAAVGVRERAGWISAIWDAILPENKKLPPSLYESFPSTSRSQTPPPSPQTADISRPLKHLKPIESPVPIPLSRLSSLLLNDLNGEDAGSHSPSSVKDRTLPPLPSPSSPTPNNSPAEESIPITTKRNHMNLHLEIPRLENTFSPSIYPITSSGGDTPESISAPQPPFLLGRSSSPSSTTVIRPFSATSYFSSRESEGSRSGYHPPSTSILLDTIKANLSTTTTTSQPATPTQSPSIAHLSQLSVVRQRLAQIERNHSEVSAKSVASSSISTIGTNAGNSITSSGLAALGSLVEPGVGTTTGRPGGTPLKRRARSPGPSLLLSRLSMSLDGESLSGTDEKTVSTPKSTNRGRSLLTGSLEGSRTLSPPPLALEPTRRRSHSRSTGSRDASTRRETTPKKPKLTKEDIEDVSNRVDAIKSVLGGQSGEPTIHEVVRGLEDKTRDNGEALGVIRERVWDIDLRLGDLASAVAVAVVAAEARSSNLVEKNEKDIEANRVVDISAAVAEVGRGAQQAVLQAIEDVKAKLGTNFPVLVDDVKEIRSLQDKLLDQVAILIEEGKDSVSAVLNNVAPAESPSPGDVDSVVDLKPVLDKLDGLTTLLETFQKVDKEKVTEKLAEGVSKEGVSEQLEKILTHVQEESTKQAIFARQQADSVRYLNELNNWLETFVTNGTSQIQGLSANVQHLSNALGCAIDGQEHPGALGPAVPQALIPGRLGSAPNLLGDIKQLVVGMQARDQNFAALQSAVHSLLEVLSSSQAQMGAESQAIAGLITRQRQEQEALLRTFTSEISGEIKGERLRFVEAMKEATAINVQLHVEHFKQDLSREVMAMTEEVGRLHREKQIIENQISDLFAFYSKHKQQETPLQPSQTNIAVVPYRREQERPQRASIPRSSHYRPLPQPRRH